jgi:4a-hydroxytetrahydrobiopterin dehydratase
MALADCDMLGISHGCPLAVGTARGTSALPDGVCCVTLVQCEARAADAVMRFQHRRDEGLMMDLADQKCVPCRGGIPPMDEARANELLRELADGWRLNAEGHLEREYRLQNFRGAMSLANLVADVAEQEGHHPDHCIAWGRCRVEIWTHKIKGLTESDFYFAAKADRAFRTLGNA